MRHSLPPPAGRVTAGLPLRDPLTAAVLSELRIRAEKGSTPRMPLMDFIPHATPDYTRPEHLAPLVALLERSVSEPVRAVVHTPPQHAKTETLLHAIVWSLQYDPKLVIGYVSYAAALAYSKSRRARALAQHVGLPLEEERVEEWRTPQGGGVIATGVGGPLTGHGLDRLLIDDPLKNRAEAESALVRERTWEWFTNVGRTRFRPGASVLVVAARWHPDDLSGRLVDRLGYEYVRLPALSDAGEALWPERYSVEALAEIHAADEYVWQSLYQGAPRHRGATVFRDAAIYDEAPTEGYRLALGIDFAYTAKTRADYSVAVLLARKGDLYYVLDVYRGQVEAPQFGAVLKAWRTQRYAPIVTYIHGTEKGTVQYMSQETKLPIDAKPATGDKFVRAQPVAAAWNAGRVLVPSEAPWLDLFLAEVLQFTGVNDRHDDQVDALAAAYDELAGTPIGSLDIVIPRVGVERQRMRMWS